jgi:hypothetical protein
MCVPPGTLCTTTPPPTTLPPTTTTCPPVPETCTVKINGIEHQNWFWANSTGDINKTLENITITCTKKDGYLWEGFIDTPGVPMFIGGPVIPQKLWARVTVGYFTGKVEVLGTSYFDMNGGIGNPLGLPISNYQRLVDDGNGFRDATLDYLGFSADDSDFIKKMTIKNLCASFKNYGLYVNPDTSIGYIGDGRGLWIPIFVGDQSSIEVEFQ